MQGIGIEDMLKGANGYDPKFFVDSAKVMSKGQVTIPKDVRNVLGIGCGDRVSFIVEGDIVRLVNSAVYAMQNLQNAMKGEAQNAGMDNEEDVIELVKGMRTGEY